MHPDSQRRDDPSGVELSAADFLAAYKPIPPEQVPEFAPPAEIRAVLDEVVEEVVSAGAQIAGTGENDPLGITARRRAWMAERTAKKAK